MDTKRWMLLVVMVGALLATAFGQSIETAAGNDTEQQRRKQVLRTKISPLITEERLQFNEQISTEDQKTIDVLREQMKNQRLLMLELQCEVRALRLEGELPGEDLKSELRAQQTVIKNTRDEAKVLADKYDDEIDQHLEQLEKNLLTLRDEFSGQQGMKHRGEGHGRNRPKGRAGAGSPSVRNLTPVGFLLWDSERS